jgi:subtilisin family serine protease
MFTLFWSHEPKATEVAGHPVRRRDFLTQRRRAMVKKNAIYLFGMILTLIASLAGGMTSISVALSGVDWIYYNAVQPAVVNFSFNIQDPAGCQGALATAFRNLITQRGILVVNSAGNYNTEAANYVPTCVPEVLVVGASHAGDQRWGPPSAPWSYCEQCGSNWGSAVDVFAPGAAIVSSGNGGGACERTGTSMAAPHATGVAALFLQRHPNATPAQVHAAIVNGATTGVLTGDLGSGSPNRLLYSLIDLP